MFDALHLAVLDRLGGQAQLDWSRVSVDTVVVTAANVSDVTMLQAVVDDIPPVRTPSGRRRARPDKVQADKGYDSQANRAWLRRRGIRPPIARRGIESSARLGATAGRWSGRCRG